MDEIELSNIKKKSISGILALSSRTFLLQIIAFGATFLLTVFLTPDVFGIFYVVSAIISFLGYFSDIGLAAALIQKKDKITDIDLSTTFLIQQGLVGGLVIIAFFLSQPIASFYRLDQSGLWLFRALVLSFFLSSLKTIPSVLLERNLDFAKLIIPQILETVGFYGVAVILAWRGMGISSFTWAVLVRGLLGLISMYIISPWRLSVRYSGDSARHLLRFGIPFQLNSLLALIKDDLLTVYLGHILPFAQVGYIGWAKKWAEVPLRLIMDSIIRVTFPAFSRIQGDRRILGKALEKTLFALALTMFPITVTLLFLVGPAVSIIPKYGKWAPALPSFYLFAVASAIAGLSTPLTNALNAVGKIKVTVKLMILWTTLTWILTTILVGIYGFNGVALALFLITATIILVVRLTKDVADFSIRTCVSSPLAAALAQTVWWIIGRQAAGGTVIGLSLLALSGGILYVGIIWALERERIGVFKTELLSLFR